ncbi:hypothetical protein Droror1_Dr00003095 [Drosera rotundifolia]
MHCSSSMAPPPNYIMLNDPHGSGRPPPYHSCSYGGHRSGGSCFKCICCCYCILFILVLVLTGLLLYAYTFYQPKLPRYELTNFEVKAFDAMPDFSLNTEFHVTGHNNVTMINVVLKGKSTFGSSLHEALAQSEWQERIQLLVAVRAPIIIIVRDKFPLRQFSVSIDCVMVVDNLRPGRKPEILSANYNSAVNL